MFNKLIDDDNGIAMFIVILQIAIMTAMMTATFPLIRMLSEVRRAERLDADIKKIMRSAGEFGLNETCLTPNNRLQSLRSNNINALQNGPCNGNRYITPNQMRVPPAMINQVRFTLGNSSNPQQGNVIMHIPTRSVNVAQRMAQNRPWYLQGSGGDNTWVRRPFVVLTPPRGAPSN